MRIDGKTAEITGAASGIGRATAEAFAQAGAHVLLGDIAEAAGAETAAAIRAKGQKADFIRLDVTDPASIEAFRREAYARGKQVDIVATVAGWGRTEPFVKNTPDFWRKLVDLNFMGTVAVVRAFLDPMIERNAGKIVTVSSDAGRVGSLGETVYSGTKGAVIGFTKALPKLSEAEKEIIKLESGRDFRVTGFGYGSMAGYYTLAEIEADLAEMFQLFPNLITQKFSIGTSHVGRTIWAAKISDNPGVNENEPTVGFDALVHAREPQSMATQMYYMWYLLENYGIDPEATYLVDNREMYFVPCFNPDGYDYNRQTDPNGGGMWRKNRRNNGGSYGVDLNRKKGAIQKNGWDLSGENHSRQQHVDLEHYRDGGCYQKADKVHRNAFLNSSGIDTDG